MQFFFLILFGLIFIAMGIFKMMGNVSSIHWYHRRNAKKEDLNKYRIWMGIGMVNKEQGLLGMPLRRDDHPQRKFWGYYNGGNCCRNCRYDFCPGEI